MKRFAVTLATLLLMWVGGDAQTQQSAKSGGFPQTVRVRLWYLRPPQEVKLQADAGLAKVRKCANCAESALTTLTLRAVGARIQIGVTKDLATEVSVSGLYQIVTPGAPPLKADFPVEIRASEGRLLVTASMPMDEYIAGVLAGETGNFKSDETLRAMAVTARTYAMHFGSRHAVDGFDFCDSTHCQNLRLGDVTPRLRKIVESTASEILWYDGEPAATYYHANCGGMTEDGRYILGNNEQRAPYLKQHSDTYCLRSGSNQWRSEVTKQELQRALAAEGVNVPGHLRSVSVLQRTASGRVEFLTVTGSQSVTVPGSGVSHRDRTQHWMGAAEEQLVRRACRERPDRVSWTGLGTRRGTLPDGSRGDGRRGTLVSRDTQLLLSRHETGCECAGNPVATADQ